MKILEMIFLILTICVPLLFIILLLKRLNKVKRNKKLRMTFIKIIFLSLIINGSIFGVIKYHNVHTNKDPIVKEQKEEKENEPSEDEDTTLKTSKGFPIEVKDGITYIDGYLVVNKTYPLPEDYVPSNTHKKVTEEICTDCLINEAYEAYANLKKDATNNNLNIYIASGYRSYNYQKGLYNSYVKRSGKEQADTYSARPGHSEHQSGYAFDLNSVTDAFANTKEGIWVNENCYKYGFIIRYPKGKSNETGYKYEPWHLRYVGVDLASKLYNAGDWITMEDYFGITSEYQD